MRPPCAASHNMLPARGFVCVSHGAVLSCGACCGAWGFHAWVCGPSGVLLGCERGRAGSTLASFFEAATMNACGAAHQGAHPGSSPGVIG